MDDIYFEKRGTAGLIALNRSKSLNALNFSMIASLRNVLRLWADDDSILSVIIKSNCDRAFCAGGDIKSAYYGLSDGRIDEIFDFFDAEYALNLEIANYPKPYIPLINGICMGGGMGISMHGGIRIACASATFAMPENKIGFFPDVGAFYALNRIKSPIGYFMALTGESIDGETAHHAGLIDYIVPAANHNEFIDIASKCTTYEDLKSSIQNIASPPTPSDFLTQHGDILDLFKTVGYKNIMENLKSHACDFAKTVYKSLHYASESSLKLTDARFQNEHDFDLNDVLKQDLKYAKSMITHPNFKSGVRALLIDRDFKPNFTK